MPNKNRLYPFLIFCFVGALIFAFSGGDEDDETKTILNPTTEELQELAPKLPAGIVVNEAASKRKTKSQLLETTQSIANDQRELQEQVAKMVGRFDELQSVQFKTLEDVAQLDIAKRIQKALDETNRNNKPLYEEEAKKLRLLISEQANKIPGGIGLPLSNDSHINDGVVVNKKNRVKKKKYHKLYPDMATIKDGNGQTIIFDKNGEVVLNTILSDDINDLQNVSNIIPFYTIPENATLVNNTTLTYIEGVVPFKGIIRSPKEFKIISGRKNLASNGYYLPSEVKEIVWRGLAKGNRERSCVEGTIHSMTFVFFDGTIYTQTSKKSTDSGDDGILGHLTGPRGNSCILGKYVDNSGQYLRDRMLVAGGSSLTTALSDISAQVTTPTTGTVLSQVKSDKTKEYIAGKTLTGGAQELLSYLRNRMDDAIDVVLLPAGENVALHINTAITIDYDKLGRRLQHAKNKIDSNNRMFD